ncbi:MAG: S-methyl-5-thioribose-1-phosphate isomerase [bacterium]|nr:S-methyl-5-thioribose-1-phosphate isomerase [bacterium]
MKFRPIERAGNCLRLIDQTRLPGELVFNEYDNHQDIIEAIKRLEVRGAPAIGISAAYALAIAAGRLSETEFSNEEVRRLGEEIKAARPTAVNLFWAIDRLLRLLPENSDGGQREVVPLLWQEAERIHEEDLLMCRRIGENGADLIASGDGILTHCNAGALATGGIGTALAIMYICHEQGKKIRVYADETRPLLQGARLTAWELGQAGIDCTLICDNAAAVLMAQGKINHVIVGADRIADNGDAANKIGTYGVAVLARAHDIPFYVAAPMTTFDSGTESGQGIEIEQRSATEITEGFGVRTAPEGQKVYAPAFDVTPNGLITGFITDQGIRPGGRTA